MGIGLILTSFRVALPLLLLMQQHLCVCVLCRTWVGWDGALGVKGLVSSHVGSSEEVRIQHRFFIFYVCVELESLHGHP